MTHRIGMRLGDFEIVRELGRGGMGVVYEARQISLNRRVALKVLSGGLGLTSKAVQRFRREAEAAAKLHHTNIVPVYATGEQDGTHFYAMELIGGPSLDHVIEQQRRQAVGRAAQPDHESQGGRPDAPGRAGQPDLRAEALDATGPFIPGSDPSSPTSALRSSSLGSGSGYFDTVARRITEVADALEYAHQQGVIHRDIKPSNLLLSPAGRLSVNDFGLARMLEQPGMTMTGEFVGTPAYMSPEQITAGRIPLDHRTDIYSLGATLYELLTLHPPFKGASREQVLAQIVQKEPKAPRRLQKKLPVDLETICLKCLEKDPDRRYQTAGALAEDLRRYVNRFAISARRAGPITKLKKWAKRNPVLTVTLAGACVLAVAAAFLAYRGHLAEQRHLAEMQQQQQLLDAEKRQKALEKALLTAMSGDVDEAEKAIAEAEKLGVSTGQVRLLRGEVAYYRGKLNEAIKHLEQAVELLPVHESAAARGLLVVAYVYAARREEANRVMQELEPIAPISVEDYLFKGSAVSQWDEERGLKILNEAVKQRPSSAIARIFRSDPLANLAMNRADPALADLAIEDAETAKRLLANTSPAALVACALTYQVAARIYQNAGLNEKSRRTLDLAAKDAAALGAFKHLPLAVFARFCYFWNFDRKSSAFDELMMLAQRGDNPSLLLWCALISYWRGSPDDLREVQKIYKRYPNNGFMALIHYGAVAELQGREAALELYRREGQRITVGHHRMYLDSIPLLLGKTAAPTVESRDDRQRILFYRPHEAEFHKKLLAYRDGVLKEADLLQAAAGSTVNNARAHYFIGLRRLAEGDRARARGQFQMVLANPLLNAMCKEMAIVFLARLEKDPRWPPWIPVKQ